jgi:hypothetical protein
MSINPNHTQPFVGKSPFDTRYGSASTGMVSSQNNREMTRLQMTRYSQTHPFKNFGYSFNSFSIWGVGWLKKEVIFVLNPLAAVAAKDFASRIEGGDFESINAKTCPASPSANFGFDLDKTNVHKKVLFSTFLNENKKKELVSQSQLRFDAANPKTLPQVWRNKPRRLEATVEKINFCKFRQN